ncbi:MAG: Dabb family protein [Abditibacteriaceae bacterium]
MIWHTVWFKLKESASAEDKEAMLTGLRALPDAITEIKVLSCGYDYSDRSEGYEIGLVVTFEKREALEIYGPHPAHKAFGDKFRSLWEDVKALDFESPE